MKKGCSPRKKYANGTGIEGMQFTDSLDSSLQEETPAQKAARERREARALLVAAQKAKNEARLAPIIAAQQVRFENWRDSSPDNANKTYEDWQTGLVKAQKKPDVGLEGLNIDAANSGYKTKGSCTTDTKREKVSLKSYAAGTGAQGVGPSNYIQSPNEVLSDYNIMLAKADQEVANNSAIPIVGMVGGLLQQGLGMASSYMGSKKPGTKDETATATPAVATDTEPASLDYFDIQNFDYSSDNAFQSRGTVAANGNNNVQADVEVEGGEMYETPQGETGEFKGPSHEEGGMPMEVGQDIPEGTKVYSDRLKVGKETLAERKEKRERQIANLEKAASEPLVDTAIKNATKRRMQAVQKEEASDLQFQEQVNNMQAMADNVIAAFGTGVEGIQKMAAGGVVGDPPYKLSFSKGFNEGMFKDSMLSYSNSLPGKPPLDYDDIENVKDYQRWLKVTPDGILGKNSFASSKLPKDTTPFKLPVKTNPGFVEGLGMDVEEGYSPTAFNVDPNQQAKEDSEYYTPTPSAPVAAISAEEVNPPGNMVSRGIEKGLSFIDKQGGLPNMGDLVGLFGDYLGATSGLKNAAEQRASDITHTNVYKNAGKESQKQLDNAMQSIESNKAQAIVKATTNTQGGKRSGRNSARGVNQMRGMDWLYDTALKQQMAEISANAANQVSDIFKTKANVALSADQLVGTGEHQANMANEAAKDAYYTAKGLGLKDQALGVQHGGKDLNAIKQNKIIENLMKSYGTYVTADSKGKIKNK